MSTQETLSLKRSIRDDAGARNPFQIEGPRLLLRDAALRLHRGGVGYYRSSDFVHVDIGRVRHW